MIRGHTLSMFFAASFPMLLYDYFYILLPTPHASIFPARLLTRRRRQRDLGVNQMSISCRGCGCRIDVDDDDSGDVTVEKKTKSEIHLELVYLL